MQKNLHKGAFLHYLKNNTRAIILIFLSVFGLMLFIISGYISQDHSKNNTVVSDDDEYKTLLEQGLKETISRIKGAGDTSVFITLDSSFETVYASNAKLDESSPDAESSQKTTERLIATTNSHTTGEAPVVVKQITPKIKGVLIVCEGAGNAGVKEIVTQAAATALNISTNRIFVTGGNSTK